ncbi:MAG: polysaccharide biosynthesis/export family protein [Sedimentisphaerales bacterium]|nr:polysaccharide biosynthesis/export family protein [Sedimentisphaerales bacterium]
MNRSKKLALAALLVAMAFASGCFTPNPEDIRAFVKPYEVDVTAENYIFQPPDEIEIHCAQVPEIDLERQRIRPDGKISFEAIGEIEAAGKTPQEVAAAIQEKVAATYVLPGDNPVDVRISLYASQVYYVVGQVMRPGPRTYTGRDSVLTAVALAQPNPLAWEERVRVIRPSAHEEEPPRIFLVNYQRMISRGDTSKDVLLQEGDIIYVPPTILAAIGMVVEEFITPVARAFYGWYLVQNPPTSTGAYTPAGGFR